MLDLARSCQHTSSRWSVGITLHGFVPRVQVLRVAAHGEGLYQQAAGVVAGAGESLAAVHELLFGPADVREDKGLQ